MDPWCCYIWQLTWIPSISSIYPLFVRIYTSTMDPMGYLHGRKRDFLGFHGTHAASGLSLARWVGAEETCDMRVSIEITWNNIVIYVLLYIYEETNGFLIICWRNHDLPYLCKCISGQKLESTWNWILSTSRIIFPCVSHSTCSFGYLPFWRTKPT